jgi:hypothetical protein
MNRPTHVTEQRKLRSIARRYERGGYRVTIPARGGDLPAFLEGFTPDLIAESDHDRVVVEVKQNRDLRGSNDLREVAERVSRQPGWRFELVTVPSVETASPPSAERMESIAKRARQALDVGLADAAYAYAWSAIEVLLGDLAVQHGLRPGKMPMTQVGRELVSLGVIPHEALDALDQARAVRNRAVNAAGDFLPSASDVEELLALGRRLRDEAGAWQGVGDDQAAVARAGT